MSPPEQTSASDTPPAPEVAALLYGEICSSHAGIADFRAKLLALLPIASGAGIFLLLQQTPSPSKVDPSLAAAGLFGFVVTLGLFLYELRGIEDCVMLRGRASYIEKHWFKVTPRGGHYLCRPPPRLRGGVSEIGAGLVVYISVMASWLYVFGRGADLDELGKGWEWVLAALAVIAVVAMLLLWDPDREAPLGRSPAPSSSSEAEP
jgi:hypothetical protein